MFTFCCSLICIQYASVFKKHDHYHVGWGACVLLLLFVSDSEMEEVSGFSVNSDNESEALADGCSYLNFPSYFFLSF